MRVGYMSAPTIAGFVIQAVLKIAFACFLWRDDVCDLFGVGKATKTMTALYTPVITFLVYGVLWLVTH